MPDIFQFQSGGILAFLVSQQRVWTHSIHVISSLDIVIVFAMSAVTVEVWPTETPIWGLVLALSVAAIYIVPTGMIQAITNQQIGLNVLTELIAGYALPGKPLALMIFKTYGYIVSHISVQLTAMLNLDGLIFEHRR